MSASASDAAAARAAMNAVGEAALALVAIRYLISSLVLVVASNQIRGRERLMLRMRAIACALAISGFVLLDVGLVARKSACANVGLILAVIGISVDLVLGHRIRRGDSDKDLAHPGT